MPDRASCDCADCQDARERERRQAAGEAINIGPCPTCSRYERVLYTWQHPSYGQLETCRTCQEHVIQCAGCQRLMHRGQRYELQEEAFCESCYVERTVPCRGCEIRLPASEMRLYNDEFHCVNCHEYAESEIRECNYRPDWKYLDAAKGALKPAASSRYHRRFYGVELEIETGSNRHSAATALKALDPDRDLFIVKGDGSLSNGFEVVTHPATLEAHRTAYPWQDICDTLIGLECRSHDTDTCGLHVHASIRNLTETDKAKITAFIHSQVALLERLGRRKFNDYCRLKPNDTKPKKDFRDGDRYAAVNWNNDSTLEFRFPKGSLRYTTIIATIELMDAIIVYCCQHGITSLMNVWITRRDFTRSMSDYSYLTSYAKEQGLCV